MTFYTNDYVLDAALDKIAEADQAVICSGVPADFYGAVRPDIWAASQAYIVGDVVRPTVEGDFVYKATTITGGGLSGAVEPTWPAAAGQTVVDNEVTWEAVATNGHAASALSAPDYTKADGDIDGRKVTVAEKTGLAIYRTAPDIAKADHIAFVDRVNRRLLWVTEIEPDQGLSAGGTVNMPSVYYGGRDAVAAP